MYRIPNLLCICKFVDVIEKLINPFLGSNENKTTLAKPEPIRANPTNPSYPSHANQKAGGLTAMQIWTVSGY